MMNRSVWLAMALMLFAVAWETAEPAVFETENLRLEIDRGGQVRSLQSKASGKEYAQPASFAVVYRGGRLVPGSQKRYGEVTQRWIYQGGETFPATRAVLRDDLLEVEFSGAGTTATFRVLLHPGHMAFELVEIAGESVDRIDWLRMNLIDLPNRGAWVNLAFDEPFGVCVCAGNVRTNVEMDQDGRTVSLRAVAEKEVGFEGTTAVLFGCNNPRDTFLEAMASVEQAYDMPRGAENRRREEQRFSYLWARRPTPENIGQYIEIARRGGFRMILLSYTSFATGAGHFAWRKEYLNGMADLKKVTDAIRSAGLDVGWHIHYSKATKSDRYVTPVPDERLHQVRRFTLAESVDEEATGIRVRENPAGCTLDDGRRILKIGQELVEYEHYSTGSPYVFTGCERGHLGTTTAAHETGEQVGLLNVDTWPNFIRLDQDTDIQDEVARRIGEIYRETGPYAMVYFDGAEDVHPPFWHHVASAQQRVFGQLDPPPPVCESALYTHFSWHMISRSNAYDIVAPAEGMKDFCRLMPCPTAAERVKDFSRIEFGWLGRFGEKNAGPDVWEYVASRAAAWDCPISLHASTAEVAANPRWEDCLDAIRTWEDARLGNHLTQSHREMLKNVRPEDAHYVPCFDQRATWENIAADRGLTPAQRRILADRREHHLFVNERGEYELVEIEELHVNELLKAYWFRRTVRPDETYVLLWAVDENVELRFPASAGFVRAMRPFGEEMAVCRDRSQVGVTVGGRSYLRFEGVGAEEIRQVLLAVE